MKLINALLTLSLFVLILTAAVFAAGGSISGKLTKADGKPLPFVEIELIPVDADQIPNDKRLWAVSGGNGTFSFGDVPPGEYQLSVNFREEPTDLSPYSTFFYPNASKREDAQVFEINARANRFAQINFRLPPALSSRKVSGKVIDSKGQPMSGVCVSLANASSDDGSFSCTTQTDARGAFSLKGFNGRVYQIRAILLDRPLDKSSPFSPPKVLATKQSDFFVLGIETANQSLTITEKDYREPLPPSSNSDGDAIIAAARRMFLIAE